MVAACFTGAFPRGEALVEATRAFDRRRLDAAALGEAYRRDAEAVVALQVAHGFPWVTDGQLNWHDLMRPLAEALEGVALGPLTRWYDNNTFYRKPIIAGPLRWQRPLGAPYFRADLLPRGRRWKAILPGPYTFLQLAEDKAYGRPRDLLLDVGDALAREAAALAAAGFAILQLSEPSLATDPPGRELRAALEGVYAELVRRAPLEVHLHTYFGDASPLLPFLLDLPVAALGFDFHQVAPAALADHAFDKLLLCGCVDARNSPIEAPEEIAAFGRKVRETVEPRGLALCPNADLDFLPRPIAEAKAAALGAAARLLEEGG